MSYPQKSIEALAAYIPMDRRVALARGENLPIHTEGAALFADISGFTPLTETLANELGPQRGAEELTYHLNQVYDAVIAELHRYRGSVIGFSGDAITCWFDGDDGRAGVAAALAIQETMRAFERIRIPGDLTVNLAVKVAVANGPVRRFVVGDPDHSYIDVLGGQTIALMAQTERTAERGEVLVTEPVIANIGDFLDIAEQDAARVQIEAYFRTGNPVKIDGVAAQPQVERCDFYGLDLKDLF